MNNIEAFSYRSLQKQLTIAKRALEKQSRGCNDQQGVASEALEQMQLIEMGKQHALGGKQ